ncbi:MAG TPA: YidC/Oxa1 family membrane protein insertase [Candidatus Saccharimonadales bacterium]|nr:YidC/Oxa1 family membrane protein insertase [Candidatus Saccharimonadales bacterium]
MFTTLIVQPIFNLLVLIYALIPGHNFGLAIILFTIAVRFLMWPLIKKQMHQVKKMRKIQPELKRIKKAAAGDKRKEQVMMLELYKERGINPFGQIGVLLVQIPILLGLYIGLQKVLKDHEAIVSFAYPFLQDLSWLKEVAANINLFDATLFGFIDLTRPALSAGGVYWPALMLVIGSAAVQFFQGKQLTPTPKDAKGLRAILREAKTGKQADQAEVNAAMGRSMLFLMPFLVLLFTIQLASALSLYWLMSGLVAIFQQWILLREDVEEMESSTDKAVAREKKAIEAEIVDKPKASSARKTGARKKRRKK